MSGRKTMVLVNPQSGGGRTGRAWPMLRRGLDEVLERWEERFTQSAGHATTLARQAVQEGFEQIVVVGGDGTLNETVNGLFPEDAEHGIGDQVMNSSLRMAIVRRGTGGDFARRLELPGSGRQLFSHLRSDRFAHMDLGLARFRGPDGRPQRRAFANVASFGLSGLVDAKINRTQKSLGSLSFVGATASALFEYRRIPLRLRVDGRLLYEGKVLLAAVAKGRFFGGGVKIAPEAELDDGRFQVVALLEAGPREVARVLDVYSGRHTDWPSARQDFGQVVEAEVLDGTSACLIDLDGEQPGQLDARFELVSKAVKLQLP